MEVLRGRHRFCPYEQWLPFADRLAFFYQQFAVVGIHGEQGAVVFENNQVAVAAQARACVHDLAIGAGHNGVAFFAANANAFVFRIIKGVTMVVFLVGQIRSVLVDA